MSKPLNDNIDNRHPKAADDRTGKLVADIWAPFDNTTEANLMIESAFRARGLTVQIKGATTGAIDEYWYLAGIADVDLVKKSTGGGGGSEQELILTNTNLVYPLTIGYRTHDILVIPGTDATVRVGYQANTNDIGEDELTNVEGGMFEINKYRRTAQNIYIWGLPANSIVVVFKDFVKITV